MKILILIFIGISCEKSQEVSLKGSWINNETIYEFNSELTITDEGISENYVYYVSNDTIYLDYGLPFKIELLTESDLVLSKNDGNNFYLYEFDRIGL